MPSDVYAKRLNNLRHLCGPDRGGQRKMAERLSMSESQMSQHVSGRKNVGSRLARKIEQTLGLPVGWMDQEHNDLSDEAVDFAREFQRLTPAKRALLRDLLKTIK